MAQLTQELVDDAAAPTPATMAVRHGVGGISDGALAAATLAGLLRACGAGKDARVAIGLPAGPAVLSVLPGASGAGRAVVPIDRAPDDECRAALLRGRGGQIGRALPAGEPAPLFAGVTAHTATVVKTVVTR